MVPQDQSADVLADLNAQFATSEEGVGTRASNTLPAMNATFRVTNAFLNRSSQANRAQLNLVCEILASDKGDEFIGKTYTVTRGLVSAQNFEWLNGDLINLELPPIAKQKDIPARMKSLPTELEGICFAATLVENKQTQYQPNCYINQGARQRSLEEASVGNSTGKF